MIGQIMKSFQRWYEIKTLQSDIAGYEDDQYTLKILGLTASPAYKMIEDMRQEAKSRLYLLQRSNPA